MTLVANYLWKQSFGKRHTIDIQVQRHGRNKKSKRDSSDEVLSQALQVLKHPNLDDMDIFGQYIASELRELKDPEIRWEAKRDITFALLKAQEKESTRS